MPNLPISGLPVVTTPLNGAELLAFVQGGVTRKGTAQNILSAGLGATFNNVAFNDTAVAGLKFNNLTSAQVAALTPSSGDSWYNSTSGFLQYYNGVSNETLLTSATLPYSTVGTSGDYATLADAFTAGKYNIVVISNVTETSDYTFNSGVDTVVNMESFGNFTVDCAIFSPFIRDNVTNLNIYISKVNFIYNYGVNKSLFGDSGTGGFCSLIIENVQIQNNSTAALSYMLDQGAGGIVIQAQNCGFLFNNGANGGLNLSGGALINCSIVGGGVNCTQVISNVFGIGINLCNVQGTWAPNNTVTPHFTLTNGFIIGMIIVAVDILVHSIGSNIGQIGLIFSGSCSIITEGNVSISNANLGAGALIYPKDGCFLNMSNCTFDNIDESLLTTTADIQLSNVNIVSALSLGILLNPVYNISNSRILGSVSISCDAVKINNSFISTFGGGGTITINATADKTILIGNTTDAAIVNGGTNTELVSNTTY